MPQGALPFKYQEEKNSTGITSLAGLPIYLDLAYVSGLNDTIKRHLKVRDGGQGWTDTEVIMSLILLNLAGGDSVEDLRILEGDLGFVQVLRRVKTYGMSGKQRHKLGGRWRKEKKSEVPSPSSVFRYLSAFHNLDEERNRQLKKAFIPVPNDYLKGLLKVNKDFISFVQSHHPKFKATLDMDATLVETSKEEALYSYKGYKAYQPLNVYWVEQDLVLHSEFRDGNVPAGHEKLRVFEEALSFLPKGVEKVYLRSDTAGYQKDLLRYCAEGKNERFGVIEFAVGVDVTDSFKGAVAEVKESGWRPLYRDINKNLIKTGQEWAEVCFVPNWVGYRKKSPEYRFLAIREPIGQLELFQTDTQQNFPFPTMVFPDSGKYKIFGLVTNREIPGDKVIWWYRERCGKSEEVHKVMKEDLAGGKLPSGSFGENAAWWAIMILAFNLNSAMKHLILGESWISKRLKAIRFAIINLPGRIIQRSRELIVRLTKGHPSNSILFEVRRKILCLAHSPP